MFEIKGSRIALAVVVIAATLFALGVGWWLSPVRVTDCTVTIQAGHPQEDVLIERALSGGCPVIVTPGR